MNKFVNKWGESFIKYTEPSINKSSWPDPNSVTNNKSLWPGLNGGAINNDSYKYKYLKYKNKYLKLKNKLTKNQ